MNRWKNLLPKEDFSRPELLPDSRQKVSSSGKGLVVEPWFRSAWRGWHQGSGDQSSRVDLEGLLGQCRRRLLVVSHLRGCSRIGRLCFGRACPRRLVIDLEAAQTRACALAFSIRNDFLDPH